MIGKESARAWTMFFGATATIRPCLVGASALLMWALWFIAYEDQSGGH